MDLFCRIILSLHRKLGGGTPRCPMWSL